MAVGFLSMILSLPSLIVILLVSLVATLITVIIYKYTTDQAKLKSIMDEQNKIKEEIKKYKDNPNKSIKLQKRAMDLSMQIMPESMKSMLFTFVPVIIIFSWLTTNMSYMPLQPGEIFSTTVNFDKIVPEQITLNASSGIEFLSPAIQDVNGTTASWKLKGIEGRHKLSYYYGNEAYTKEVLIVSKGNSYLNPVMTKEKKLFFLFPMNDGGIPEKSNIVSITINMRSIMPFGESFNIFGWHPGWLSIYIISSIFFSTIFRKYLKVY